MIIPRFFGFAVAITLFAAHELSARDPLFRLTLRVVDDEGHPVAGAEARIGAERRSNPGESEGHGVFAGGQTDEKGFFSGEVEAWNATQAGYRVDKKGYYEIWFPYTATSVEHGKWQPWNPTIEVVLKRIRNPVPMYAKRVIAEIPLKAADVGYDLQVGDWIAPYGKGKISDMVFHGEGEVQDDSNYRGVLDVTFPGKDNGLIPCEVAEPYGPLRMPYTAPLDGYLPSRQWRSSRKYDAVKMENKEYIKYPESDPNFFIRVRAQIDSQGKVVHALYGKIHAPFSFEPRGKNAFGKTKLQLVVFTYFLNPDGTPNVEYDPTRNLLKSPKLHDPDYENVGP